MTIAPHFPQAWLDIDKRGRQPTVALARVLPAIDRRPAFFDKRSDGLETVRRLQRPPQHAVQPEAMQCQGLVAAFSQTAGRRLSPILPRAMQLPARSHGLVVCRPVVRPREALPPQRLLGLGQLADHVLPRVPRTPLDHGAATERLPNGRPEPCAAVEDHQHALRGYCQVEADGCF